MGDEFSLFKTIFMEEFKRFKIIVGKQKTELSSSMNQKKLNEQKCLDIKNSIEKSQMLLNIFEDNMEENTTTTPSPELECREHEDCSAVEGKKVCNKDLHRCVECSTESTETGCADEEKICVSYGICIEAECTEDSEPGGAFDENCKEKEEFKYYCQNKRCVECIEGIDNHCKIKGTKCAGSKCKECSQNKNCDPPKMCIEELCVECAGSRPEEVGLKLSNEEDSSIITNVTMICNKGNFQACSRDDECGVGMICNQLENRLVQTCTSRNEESVDPECNKNKPCIDGKKCLQNECVEDSDSYECVKDSDCEDGKICFYKYDENKETTECKECDDDTNACYNKLCENIMCKKCSDNNECPNNQNCTDGMCIGILKNAIEQLNINKKEDYVIPEELVDWLTN